MGAAVLPILAITSVIGVGTSIWGGIESRNANRRQEVINHQQQEEYKRQVEQERRLAEEQQRLEKERLLKNIGFQREELTIKETVFKARQELEEKQTGEKILNLRQTYQDIFSEYNAAQTVRGLTNTLVPKQERLTHDYLKDNEELALLKSFMKTQGEQGAKGIDMAKRELDNLESLGKESVELNLKGITNKAEAEISMSNYKIRAMREQVQDLNKASIINDIGGLFKAGASFATSYLEQSMYTGIVPKFNYSGNDYGGVMKNLTFGKPGNAFAQMGWGR
ncbi:hypothetical protein GAMM_260012 [Gammaproteobacteria bacterium]